MMLKKYVMSSMDVQKLTELSSALGDINIPESVNPTSTLNESVAFVSASNLATCKPIGSIIEKTLSSNNITIIEKHYPEKESELNEISYLLNCIANHIDRVEDLFHILRKAIAENNGKFVYNPNKLNAEQLESVQTVIKILKTCGVFSELRLNGSYTGTVSSATRVRSFISGSWLELFCQQHGIDVVSKKAKELNLPYEILCNVKVVDHNNTHHEIDLMFSIGDSVFAVEMKSGLNFMDYDRYRLLAEYLHLIPDRFMLVNSTLLDKDATKCISFFYRYFICNSEEYINTLSKMIDKAINS